jgi:hypothetical protein
VIARVLAPAETSEEGTEYASHCTASSSERAEVAALFQASGAGAFSAATGVPLSVAPKPSAQRTYSVNASSVAGGSAKVKAHSASRRALTFFIAGETSVSTSEPIAPA